MGQRLFIRRAAYLEIDKFPEAIGRRATAVTVTNTSKFHGHKYVVGATQKSADVEQRSASRKYAAL